MRTAEDIIQDYKARGYSHERLRALANGRPEPVRSQMLALLEDPEHQEIDAAVDDIMASADAEMASDLTVPNEEPQAEVEEVAEDQETVQAEVEEVAEDEETVQAEPEEVAEDQETVQAEGEDVAEDDETVQAEQVKQEVLPVATPAPAETVVMSSSPASDTAIIQAELQEAFSRTFSELENAFASIPAKPAAEVALDQIQVLTAEDLPKLAPILVERLTSDEYSVNLSTMAESPGSIIDLRAETADADMIFDPAEIGIVEAASNGEVWPSVASVEAAEHAEALSSDEQCALIRCPPDEDYSEVAAELGGNKAAKRSLEVIQQAVKEDPSLLEATEARPTVIPLNPPYALGAEGENDSVADTEGEVLAADQESSLIQFPSDIIPMYEAINHTNEQRELPVPENDGAFMTDSEIMAIELPNEDEATAEVEAITIGEFSAEDSTSAGQPTVQEEAYAAAVETEIASLRNWLAELEDALNCKDIEARQLAAMIEDRDGTLAIQAGEIDRLREEIALQTEGVGNVSAAEERCLAATSELQSVNDRLARLQREHNILSTETLPNLHKDKNDLVQLLEEQTVEQQTLQEGLSASGRRLALSYTLAAAASFLMVLMPVLHLIHTKNREAEYQVKAEGLIADRREADDRAGELEAQKLALQHTIQQAKQNFAIDKTHWEREQARLKRLVDEKTMELVRVKQEIGPRSDGLSREQVMQDNRSALGTSGRSNTGTLRIAPRRDADSRRTLTPRSDKFVDATVQGGEGLSDILLRKLGSRGDQTVWDEVARLNSLRKHSRRDYYIIHPGQKLRLPKNPGASSGVAAIQW